MQKKDEELVSRLSYEIVKEVAPDELDLFADFKEEFLKNPNAFSEKEPKKREQMLGFALPPGTEQFITIIVLPIVFTLIDKYIIQKHVTNKEKEKSGQDKINQLREEAYQNATSLGMDEEKAGLLANALVGKAALLGFK